MLARRLIACLDVRDGRVVKGIQFDELRDAGDPAEQAERHARDGIDEIVLLDIAATLEQRKARAATVREVADRIFVPLAVGGGIESVDDAHAVLDAGADKVAVNTGALRNPALITTLANIFGSQAVVVATDARRTDAGGFQVFSHAGRVAESPDAVSWACEAERRGAGEILLTSIDRDGTQSGFDCELTAAVSTAVSIPVIASGGAGTAAHFAEVFTRGCADAALAASIFHFSPNAVGDLKTFLAQCGVPIRLSW